MSIWQTIRIALKALLINKLRSFLTVLGVIIGVSAVIAMVAMGSGARAQVQATFATMGTNMLVIQPGSTNAGGARGGSGSASTLTWGDLQAIRDEVPTIRYAAAQLRTNAQIQGQGQNWFAPVYGTSPEFFALRDWAIASGDLFAASDVASASKVVVLGQTVVENLFGPSYDPVGSMITVRNIPFQVVGVLAAKGQSGTGQDIDDAVFIPQTTFQSSLQGGLRQFLSGSILTSATSAAELSLAQAEVTNLLRDRHHLDAGSEDDFSIRNLTEVANAMQQGTETLTLLLASIAAVSLLVGGIGIMNIMLVSVTERTREIGLRMALGAKPHQILAQFLIEAVCLSVVGGLVGLLLGVGVAEGLAVRFHWPIQLSPAVMALAVGFSALVGVAFGLYPAQKASRLSPIDALRFE